MSIVNYDAGYRHSVPKKERSRVCPGNVSGWRGIILNMVRHLAAALLFVGLVAACTDSSVESQVVGDQATVPDVEVGEEVGVATNPVEFERQWSKFGMVKPIPAVDFQQYVVLFFAFGESGVCPFVFGGVEVSDSTVTLQDAQREDDCTDDYIPRTVAVTVDRAALPPGVLRFDMSTGVTDMMISVDTLTRPPEPTLASTPQYEVDLVLTPQTVTAGEDVRVQIANRTPEAKVATGQRLAVERWTGHHFEHITIVQDEEVVTIEPGQTADLMTIDVSHPAFAEGPSWYRLTSKMDLLLSDGGSVVARANLHVTD